MEYQAYTEYIDTGIDWLGLIPKEWASRRLKYFSVTVSTGTTPPSSSMKYYDEPDTIWYTPVDFCDGSIALNNSKRKISSLAIREGVVKKFKADSVLVVGIGATLGKVAFSQHEFTCNQQINVIVPDDYMVKKFVAYSLSVKTDIMKMISNASTLGIMNQEKTKQINLCAPDKKEQKTIVDFLDFKTQQIDQLIKKKKALIEKLNEQRIAVITQAVTKGLDKNAKMKPSGVDWLGDVPEHWDLPKLIHRTSRIGDGLHSTPEYQDLTEYYFVNGNNLSSGRVNIGSTAQCVSESEYKKHYIHLDDSSVLLSINGTIGNVARYKNEKIILGKSAAYINCLKSLEVDFLLFYLQSSRTHDYFYLEMTGTTIFNLSLSSIRKMRVCLPPINEQKKIVKFLQKANKKNILLEDKIKKAVNNLEEYRKAVITSTVTGKIDVRNIKIKKTTTNA